jgi:hypothetical protein
VVDFVMLAGVEVVCVEWLLCSDRPLRERVTAPCGALLFFFPWLLGLPRPLMVKSKVQSLVLPDGSKVQCAEPWTVGELSTSIASGCGNKRLTLIH